MKVWLDDLRDMPAHFDCHARSAAEAIRLLGSGAIDEISLDHDLGSESNGTGYDVARWIEQMAFAWSQDNSTGLPPLRWNIHSQNPVGVGNMHQALRNADRFWAVR